MDFGASTFARCGDAGLSVRSDRCRMRFRGQRDASLGMVRGSFRLETLIGERSDRPGKLSQRGSGDEQACVSAQAGSS